MTCMWIGEYSFILSLFPTPGIYAGYGTAESNKQYVLVT